MLYQDAGPLVPALHSYWLVIHVLAAVIASGAFAVGAGAGAVPGQGPGDPARHAAARRLPRPAALAVALERVAYRLNAFGFPIWTFAALVAGPIWAEYAWGSYWNWDPKEVWAFITWVIYAAYLHARATAGWKGKAAAIIALVGFASLLFNFVGINFFFGGGSMHSYAAPADGRHRLVRRVRGPCRRPSFRWRRFRSRRKSSSSSGARVPAREAGAGAAAACAGPFDPPPRRPRRARRRRNTTAKTMMTSRNLPTPLA